MSNIVLSNMQPVLNGSWKKYVETIPQKFRAIQIASVAIAISIFLVVGMYVSHLKNVNQMISHDTVPSIVAAEKLRHQLSTAHADFINIYLTGEKGNSSPIWLSYIENIKKGQASYFEAAQNITYGDSEKTPIYTVMTSLNEYERLVGAARLSGKYSSEVQEADKLMQETILPAAIALDKANYDVLNTQYNSFKNTNFIYLSLLSIYIFAVAVFLVWIQKFLYKKTKRKFNIGMLVSSVTFVFGFVAVLIMINLINNNIHDAKEDAFDSVNVMWKTKATGAENNFIESRYLLEDGNKFNQKVLFTEFDKRAKLTEKYLTDELMNITFSGEQKSASEAMKHFKEYIKIDNNIRTLEKNGNHMNAVKLALGTNEGESNWVFAKLEASINEVLNINQKEFELLTKSAFTKIYILDLIGFIMAVIFGVGAFLGIKPRIEEYDF